LLNFGSTGIFGSTAFMNILLTGAAGFIGSCFLRRLNDAGFKDIWLADTMRTADGVQNLAEKKYQAYLSREELLEQVQAGKLNHIDLTIHLGACSDTTEMDRAFLTRNNLQYSQTLARWALDQGKQFQYASSASVYGDGSNGYSDDDAKLGAYRPLNPYAKSKHAFDEWVISERLTNSVVGYRYFNVFGPNEYHKAGMRSMVCKAIDQINTKGHVELFASSRPGFADGSEARDFIYSKDVNEAMMYFVTHPKVGGIFNIGTGRARSFKDLILAVFSALKKAPSIEYIPMPERLKNQYQYFTEADLAKLRASGCAVQFRSLEESVADYVLKHLTQPNPYY
jgi:ADP-L-glycero-D-manno-heptose 6-epimerase